MCTADNGAARCLGLAHTKRDPVRRSVTGRMSSDDSVEVGESVSPERALHAFRAAMQTAAADPTASERLAAAGVTVVVHPAEREDLSLWLHLDREPISVESSSHGGEPDIRVWIASDVLVALPHAHLAMAIAKRRARFDGPVRCFLQVLPIVRGAVERTQTAAEAAA